ncbi:MAG: DUF1653 domain-containing protein [Gammaproteobacteria bacterium]|nr:DUF1653 domain-containing protein [Gammaproteobacteria bacterium]
MVKLGLYEHYSGKQYQVIGVAKHSETLEDMVIYQALYDGYHLWARPQDMFFSNISVNGIDRPRFSFIGETVSVAPTAIIK